MTVETTASRSSTTDDTTVNRFERTAGAGLVEADLARLRRLQWAVRAILALGVAASVCANVLHAREELIAQAIAAWPPLALLLTVELVSRVPVHRRSLAVVRIAATAAIAGIAAYVSYWHMAAVAARYGENGVAPYLLPLSVDGLIVVASVSLVELAGRVAAARAVRHGEEVAPPGHARSLKSVGGTDKAEPVLHPAVSSTTPHRTAESPRSQRRPDVTGDADGSADLVMLLPAARAARDALHRHGRSLSRDALAAQLRADGHTIATARVSALLTLLRTDTANGGANGGHGDTS